MQFAEPIDSDGNRVCFEYPPTYSTILLPDDVEKETIENTIEENGEMLNYDKDDSCNEIVVTNENKDLKPVGVFVKVLGNEDHSEKVRKAKSLSEKLGVPYIEIDKALCRERLGLAPLTEKEKEKFRGKSI